MKLKQSKTSKSSLKKNKSLLTLTWSPIPQERKSTTISLFKSLAATTWTKIFLLESKNLPNSLLTSTWPEIFSSLIEIWTLSSQLMRKTLTQTSHPFIFTQAEDLLQKPSIWAICCHSFSTSIFKKPLMSRLLSKSLMMKSISISKEVICLNLPNWLMKIWRTFLRLDLTPKRLSFSLILNTWAQCTRTSADSKNTSTWVPSKLFLVWISATAVVKLLIQPSRQHLACQQLSLTFSETEISHAWFHVVLIKIHTSEWQETYVENWKHQNQQGFIQSSSHLCKDSEPRCQHQTPVQAFSLQIHQNKLKRKSIRQSLVEVLQKRNRKSSELISQKTFLITIWPSSWKTTKNWQKLVSNMPVVKCSVDKLRRLWSRLFKILSRIIKRKEPNWLMMMSKGFCQLMKGNSVIKLTLKFSKLKKNNWLKKKKKNWQTKNRNKQLKRKRRKRKRKSKSKKLKSQRNQKNSKILKLIQNNDKLIILFL